MKHNCQFKDDEGEVYSPFLDAVMAGYIEYDDFYDAYVIVACTSHKKRFVFFPKACGLIDILRHCPFCGDELPNQNKDWKRTQ